MLEILYRDEHIIGINKPHGLLVHKSPIAADASEFAIQLLRDQINQKVFPVHRIDRKTSGVLLFALEKEAERKLQMAFDQKQIDKTYWAIVRGYTPLEGTIDYALHNEKGVEQDAVTHFKTLAQVEIPLASGKHATSRYSWVEVKPETGRMHQIRKHFAHIFHPILGDRPHGCNKQNKLWLENFGMKTMMLHALQLSFKHPVSQEIISIEAPLQPEFQRVKTLLGI